MTEVSLPLPLYAVGGAKRIMRPGAADKNLLRCMRPAEDSKFCRGIRREPITCGIPPVYGGFVRYLGLSEIPGNTSFPICAVKNEYHDGIVFKVKVPPTS